MHKEFTAELCELVTLISLTLRFIDKKANKVISKGFIVLILYSMSRLDSILAVHILIFKRLLP